MNEPKILYLDIETNGGYQGIEEITMIVLSSAFPVLAQEQTITGIINDVFQVVTDEGLIYDVEDNETGNDMVYNHVGKMVKVIGNVTEEEGGLLLLMVGSYEVLDEQLQEDPAGTE